MQTADTSCGMQLSAAHGNGSAVLCMALWTSPSHTTQAACPASHFNLQLLWPLVDYRCNGFLGGNGGGGGPRGGGGKVVDHKLVLKESQYDQA